MRVIAGTARGIRLTAPPGYDVRPTLDRVREALFSIIAPRLEAARFLDLYAGTGANAIEALSRGAEHATLVENDPRSLDAIKKNLAATRLADRASVRRLTLPDALNRLGQEDLAYDIIFADPPFADFDYPRLLQAIADARLTTQDAIIVIEHPARTDLPDHPAPLNRHRTNRYGDISLSFFKLTD